MTPHASVIEPAAPLNRDPLAHHLARKHINRAQYLAGQEFRKLYASKDGRLAKSYSELGADGSALVHAMLIEGMTAKQIAESRGGTDWERFYARRLWECLNTLAGVYGFSNEEKIRASGARTQIIGAQQQDRNGMLR